MAKSAISIGKKTALAFDCVDATGVRLHNYSACEFIKHEYYDQDTPKQKCRCGRRKCKEIGKDIKYKDGTSKTIKLLCRIDTQNEVEYYKNGGILQYVLRNMLN